MKCIIYLLILTSCGAPGNTPVDQAQIVPTPIATATFYNTPAPQKREWTNEKLLLWENSCLTTMMKYKLDSKKFCECQLGVVTNMFLEPTDEMSIMINWFFNSEHYYICYNYAAI